MIGPTGAVKVIVATKPVDFRKGAEGLAALVRETMGADPFSGAVYVFRAKRTDRIKLIFCKLIFWDGTGVCLYAKRLEDGEFRWPKVQDGVMRLTAAQLSALLEGLDWRRVHEARRTRVPVQAG
ncbi:IS66 family insertion sequence element accessory protein TnpB [Mesorhizobium amorphae]|uniref:IS66 family insertion sequence element accessory protein TnpB n=1 Tax=Mesorhizobium amorphae TaxID=71433 RepID=UPI00177CA39D